MTFSMTLVLAAAFENFQNYSCFGDIFITYRCNSVQQTQTLVSTKTGFIRTNQLRLSILVCLCFDICSI